MRQKDQNRCSSRRDVLISGISAATSLITHPSLGQSPSAAGVPTSLPIARASGSNQLMNEIWKYKLARHLTSFPEAAHLIRAYVDYAEDPRRQGSTAGSPGGPAPLWTREGLDAVDFYLKDLRHRAEKGEALRSSRGMDPNRAAQTLSQLVSADTVGWPAARSEPGDSRWLVRQAHRFYAGKRDDEPSAVKERARNQLLQLRVVSSRDFDSLFNGFRRLQGNKEFNKLMEDGPASYDSHAPVPLNEQTSAALLGKDPELKAVMPLVRKAMVEPAADPVIRSREVLASGLATHDRLVREPLRVLWKDIAATKKDIAEIKENVVAIKDAITLTPEETAQRELDRKIEYATSRAAAGLNIVTQIARLADPEVGRAIEGVGKAAISAGVGVAKILAGGWNVLLGTSDILSSLGSLVGLFGEDPDQVRHQQVMNAIAGVHQEVSEARRDIAELRSELGFRFYQVQEQLYALQTEIVWGFRVVTAELAVHGAKLDALRTEVQDLLIHSRRIEEHVRTGFESLIQQPFVMAYETAFGSRTLSDERVQDCLVKFKLMAIRDSTHPLFTGEHFAAEDLMRDDLVGAYLQTPVADKLGFLPKLQDMCDRHAPGTSSLQTDDEADLCPTPVVSPLAFIAGASAYLRLVAKYPKTERKVGQDVEALLVVAQRIKNVFGFARNLEVRRRALLSLLAALEGFEQVVRRRMVPEEAELPRLDPDALAATSAGPTAIHPLLGITPGAQEYYKVIYSGVPWAFLKLAAFGDPRWPETQPATRPSPHTSRPTTAPSADAVVPGLPPSPHEVRLTFRTASYGLINKLGNEPVATACAFAAGSSAEFSLPPLEMPVRLALELKLLSPVEPTGELIWYTNLSQDLPVQDPAQPRRAMVGPLDALFCIRITQCLRFTERAMNLETLIPRDGRIYPVYRREMDNTSIHDHNEKHTKIKRLPVYEMATRQVHRGEGVVTQYFGRLKYEVPIRTTDPDYVYARRLASSREFLDYWKGINKGHLAEAISSDSESGVYAEYYSDEKLNRRFGRYREIEAFAPRRSLEESFRQFSRDALDQAEYRRFKTKDVVWAIGKHCEELLQKQKTEFLRACRTPGSDAYGALRTARVALEYVQFLSKLGGESLQIRVGSSEDVKIVSMWPIADIPRPGNFWAGEQEETTEFVFRMMAFDMCSMGSKPRMVLERLQEIGALQDATNLGVSRDAEPWFSSGKDAAGAEVERAIDRILCALEELYESEMARENSPIPNASSEPAEGP